MNLTNRRLQLAGLLVLAALVVALMMRDVVEQIIIRPFAYLFWLLGLVYRFIPQPIVWLLLVLFLIYLALGSLASQFADFAPRSKRSRQIQGPVDELATQIERRQGGIYFKWQISRTLGQIAMDLQELRLHSRRKLEFDETAVSPQVREYLEAGLNSSFSDYPMPGFRLPARIGSRGNPKTAVDGFATPFDGDIGAVIAYLESKMENDDDFRRP